MGSSHAVRRVGDVVKFGLSTRLYLFGGPEELRPAEGLTKLQKRQLAALEVGLEVQFEGFKVACNKKEL